MKVNAPPTAEKKSLAHILQCYDVGVLSISQQNLYLLRRICAGFVNHLSITKNSCLLHFFLYFSLHNRVLVVYSYLDSVFSVGDFVDTSLTDREGAHADVLLQNVAVAEEKVLSVQLLQRK